MPDAYDDPRFNQTVDKDTGYRTVSMLCVPLIRDNQVIAVVQTINKFGPGALQSRCRKGERGVLLECWMDSIIMGTRS